MRGGHVKHDSVSNGAREVGTVLFDSRLIKGYIHVQMGMFHSGLYLFQTSTFSSPVISTTSNISAKTKIPYGATLFLLFFFCASSFAVNLAA